MREKIGKTPKRFVQVPLNDHQYGFITERAKRNETSRADEMRGVLRFYFWVQTLVNEGGYAIENGPESPIRYSMPLELLFHDLVDKPK